MIDTVRGELTGNRMQDLLCDAGVLSHASRDRVRFQTVASDTEYRAPLRVSRHHVLVDDESIASIKQIPRAPAFDHDAILAVYSNYRQARAFRPIRLLGYVQDDACLWLVEEFVRDMRTLEACVQADWFSADEATDRMVNIVDDIWSLGAACSGDSALPELDELEPAFRVVFESRAVADSLYRSFREMFRWCGAAMREVLSTRDYIGRNIGVLASGECVLLDTDLSRSTRCFNLSILRAKLHTTFSTSRLQRAVALQGWDPTLLEVGMLAAEYQLQTSLQPSRLHDSSLAAVRTLLRRALEPQLHAVCEQREQRAAAAESELQHARLNHEAVLAARDAELARLHQRAGELVAEVQRLGAEGHALQNELTLRQNHVVNLEAIHARLNEEIGRQLAEAARRTAELEALSQATRHHETEMARLRQELSEANVLAIATSAQCSQWEREAQHWAERLAPDDPATDSPDTATATGEHGEAAGAETLRSRIAARVAHAVECVQRLSAAETERDEHRMAADRLKMELEDTAAAAARREEGLSSEISDKDRHIQNVEAIVHDIQGSRAWWWLSAYRRLRHELWRYPRATLKHMLRHGPRIVRLPGRLGSVARAIEFNYDHWIARVEQRISPTDAVAAIERLAYQPLISVVMPTYNTRPEWLVAAIQSVQRQYYTNWELCVADDCSTEPAVRALLSQAASDDPRIKLALRESNGGIAAASNDALALATGEFVALLDHDDELPADALLHVVQALNNDQQLDLIYSDEDKLDERGQRCEPHFKPDWAPDTLLCVNYICHLLVCRTGILRAIGGFRAGYDGSQDYDLLLRVTERTRAVHHLPRVLYHWRKSAQSTSQSASAKGYAEPSAQRALADAMERRGIPIDGVDIGKVPTTYRIRYRIAGQPTVHAIIPTRNNRQYLERCIDRIQERTTYPNVHLHVIDNGSDDPETLAYFESIRHRDRITVHEYRQPFNYSAINNWAVSQVDGEYLLLLNDDTEVINPDWLTAMMEHACRPTVGAVGAKLLYPDGRLQHAGVVLGIGGVAGHSHKYAPRTAFGYMGRVVTIQNYSAVTAACLLTRRDVFAAVGGLNETELAVAFNDVDFCLRVRERGYNVVYTPHAELYHHESVSRGPRMNPKEVAYMMKRWGNLLEQDPFYSPHLTREHEDFSLRA